MIDFTSPPQNNRRRCRRGLLPRSRASGRARGAATAWLSILVVSISSFHACARDRWRLIAPDFPGFGYSGTPEPNRFAYTFDGYADFLARFTTVMNLTRYALYLHDYGSQIGLRLAMKAPERVVALIIQNGDI